MTTLLIVDDEPLNRDALQRRLARVGYRVLTADSGQELWILPAPSASTSCCSTS